MRYYQLMHSGLKVLKERLASCITGVPADQENGSSSVAILIAVIFLAILLFAAVNLVQFVMFNINHFRLQDTLREPLEKEAMHVLELLYTDKTPEAESPLDQVWEYIGKNNRKAEGKDEEDILTGSEELELGKMKEVQSTKLNEVVTSDEETSTDGNNKDGEEEAEEKEEPEPKPVVPGTVMIKLEDISSRLNLNWLDTEFVAHLISNTTLKLFKDPKGDVIANSTLYTQDFNTFREKAGLTLHPEQTYKDWVQPKAFKKGYFTAYSYFNINVTNVFVFRQIFKDRFGENGAEAFEKKMKDLYTNSLRIEPIADGMTLSGFRGQIKLLKDVLGSDEDKFYPVINDLPLMNIHFMKRDYAKQLLTAYEVRTEWANAFLGNIFKGTDSDIVLQELPYKKLRELLVNQVINPKYDEPKNGNRPMMSGYFFCRILDLFGSYTWFWKLTITGAAYTDPLTGNSMEPQLTWIIARVPQPNVMVQDPKKLKFRILEKEFTVNKL